MNTGFSTHTFFFEQRILVTKARSCTAENRRSLTRVTPKLGQGRRQVHNGSTHKVGECKPDLHSFTPVRMRCATHARPDNPPQQEGSSRQRAQQRHQLQQPTTMLCSYMIHDGDSSSSSTKVSALTLSASAAPDWGANTYCVSACYAFEAFC